MQTNFVAIAGGSGSGKTTFAEELRLCLGESCEILGLDNYYKPKAQQSLDRNGIENFDIPSAFDQEKLERDLASLAQKKAITLNKYNYNQTDLPKFQFELHPKEFVIVEGLFALWFKAVLEVSSFNIFINSNLETAFKRRLQRDKIERGYGEDDVTYRFYQHAVDSYLTYIYPSRTKANIELPNLQSLNELKNKAFEVSKQIKISVKRPTK